MFSVINREKDNLAFYLKQRGFELKNIIIPVSLLIILFTNSCVSQKTQAFDKTFPEPSKEIKYPLVENFKTVLERVSPIVEFKSGTTPQVIFRLKNLNTKRLILPEWMMKEENNIKIYYAPWSKGQKKPEKDQWKVLIPQIEENPKRMTLDLAPRNSVLLKTKLNFVKDMQINSPQDFLIYGELNLSSLPIKSRLMKIRINP